MDPGSPAIGLADAQKINAEASTWMKQGIRLLADGAPAAAQALECFDRALELRRRLPLGQWPLLRYDVAACWLNRSEALLQLPDNAMVRAAIQACDEAIALLEVLPFDHDARFPRRFAIAHQHRGRALQASRGAGDADAIAAFMTAIAILGRECSVGIPDRMYLLGALWLDVASAHMAMKTSESRTLARDAAFNARSLVAALERDDENAAHVGVKARHMLCRVLAGEELALPATIGTMGDHVHQATDLADEGLALVQHWEHRGVIRFRAVAHDLFRFGASVYARFQPQFLQEFVQDHLNPDRSSRDYVDSDEMRMASRDFLT